MKVAVCNHFAHFIASMLVFQKARSLRSLTFTARIRLLKNGTFNQDLSLPPEFTHDPEPVMPPSMAVSCWGDFRRRRGRELARIWLKTRNATIRARRLLGSTGVLLILFALFQIVAQAWLHDAEPPGFEEVSSENCRALSTIMNGTSKGAQPLLCASSFMIWHIRPSLLLPAPNNFLNVSKFIGE